MRQLPSSFYALFVLILFSCVLTSAQQPSRAIEASLLARTPGGDEPAYTFTKRVNEVNLVFTVTDKKGRLVRDLTADDLQLLDNKHAPASLRFFQKQSDLPLRIALLIDTSSSIERRLNFEKRGARMFLKELLRPEIDEAFVASFDERVHVLQDFTNNPELLARSFNGLKAAGQTVLFDALVLAARKLRETGNGNITRRVIVLITDGEDNRSKALLNDAEQAVIGSDAVVYALSTNNLIGLYPQGEAVLELLTRSTGGSILPVRAEGQFKKAFAELEKALRSQYALGYSPENFQADGSFHSVELTSRKRGYKVRCRRGYFAGKN
jgi:Ca-activated chloride channel homolog